MQCHSASSTVLQPFIVLSFYPAINILRSTTILHCAILSLQKSLSGSIAALSYFILYCILFSSSALHGPLNTVLSYSAVHATQYFPEVQPKASLSPILYLRVFCGFLLLTVVLYCTQCPSVPQCSRMQLVVFTFFHPAMLPLNLPFPCVRL